MSERYFLGPALHSADQWEATVNTKFGMFRIDHPTLGCIDIALDEAVAMAKWILEIHPYGRNQIT